MRIVVLNPSDFRHWTLYVKGCGPWTDTTTPRTDKPVRFFPRRSFPETGWRSHVWTPRDTESAERHAAMLA